MSRSTWPSKRKPRSGSHRSRATASGELGRGIGSKVDYGFFQNAVGTLVAISAIGVGIVTTLIMKSQNAAKSEIKEEVKAMKTELLEEFESFKKDAQKKIERLEDTGRDQLSLLHQVQLDLALLTSGELKARLKLALSMSHVT